MNAQAQLRPEWRTAESILSETPLVTSVRLIPIGKDRPWALVAPDYAALSGQGFGNVFEALRFRLETQASSLPVQLRPAGFTLVRSDVRLDRDSDGLSAAVVAADFPRVIPGLPSIELHPLDAEWVARFDHALGDHGRPTQIGAETSLEFDLGLDSLDRIDVLTALAQAAGNVPVDLDRLNACRTVGDVLSLLNEPRTPRHEPNWRPIAPEMKFLCRRPSVSWSIVMLVRLFLRAWTRRRFDLQVTADPKIDWHRRPLLIAQNHQSVLDPPLLAAALPASVHRELNFLGFSGYFSRGVGRVASRLFRVQPISADRGLAAGLKGAEAALRAGRVVCIYPEGERTWDGRLLPFKRGLSRLVRATSAWVVPSAIVGAYEAWPRGWKLVPHPVRIAFGAPIPPPEMGNSIGGSEAHLTTVRQAIARLMRDLGADPDLGCPKVWANGPIPKHPQATSHE